MQKKDVDIQTSIEQIEVPAASSGKPTASLPSHTAEPYQRDNIHPSVDVQTLPVTETSDDHRLMRDLARPESGRDRTVYHGTAKHHGYAQRDSEHEVPLPPSRTRSVSPRVDPGVGFEEEINGTVSTRSVRVDPSSGTHKPSGGGEVRQNGVRVKKLPSSEAGVPCRSVDHDREPSVSSRTRVRPETDDEDIVPSRSAVWNRGPAYSSHTRVPADSDNENRVTHSRDRVPSRFVMQNRGPLCDSHSRVPADSDNDDNSRDRVPSRSAGQYKRPAYDSQTRVPSYRNNEDRVRYSRDTVPSQSTGQNRGPAYRVPSDSDDGVDISNQRRRGRGQTHKRSSREAEDRRQLSLTENLDMTSTTVWSAASPEHSVHGQSRLHPVQVCVDFASYVKCTGKRVFV